MYIGNRRIRSAGRSSGSIEVTLPVQLQELEGIECRMLVRDGPRPEIVLQPDLSAAQALFHEVWARLRQGLGEIDEVGDFALSEVTLAFFPNSAWSERPPLACADALAIARARRSGNLEACEQPLTRMLVALGSVAGRRLGLRDQFALAFGDAIAYLITGTSLNLGAEFERGMAHQLSQPFEIGQHPRTALQATTWERLRAGLRRVYEQFALWQDDPMAYTAARDRWYRALALEIGHRQVEPERGVYR
jgi:hypothetical protein